VNTIEVQKHRSEKSSSEVSNPLAAVTVALQSLRESYLQPFRELESFTNSFRFNTLQTDTRAVKPDGVIRAYLTIAKREGREPTIAELCSLYNGRYRTNFQKRAVRDCVRLINAKAPEGMRRIVLARETTSQVHDVAVIDSLIKILSRGEFASSRKILKELRQDHPKCKITPSGLKKYLKRLRRAGIDIKLKIGELTEDIVRETFRALAQKHGKTPSIGQLCARLQKEHGVSTNRYAAAKMLEKVRNRQPEDERSQWLASRSRKAYDHELRNAYREVRRKLKEQQIGRRPAVSEIIDVLAARNPSRIPSQASVVTAFERLNESRKQQGKPKFRFVRQVFPHLDRIESASNILRERGGRAPTIPEICRYLKSLQKEGERKLSESQVSKGLRTLRRSRREWPVALFSERRRTNVYNEDILSQHSALLALHGRNPTRLELWEAVRRANPESKISLAGFDYRIKSLRRAGHTLGFKGSPKLSAEERRAAREKARVEKRKEWAHTIVSQVLSKRYSDAPPKYIQEKRGFFIDCVSIALEERMEFADGVREMQELLRVQELYKNKGAARM
jgi:hypothetical protein